jgi:two-component system, OmpR family, phosphate regulon response regulator PhoB
MHLIPITQSTDQQISHSWLIFPIISLQGQSLQFQSDGILIANFFGIPTNMKKILIVDDDRDLLYGLNALLTNRGYSIKTIADGLSASDTTLNFNPDLIMLDVHLADSDGIKICFELKNNSRTSHIPILMISADSEDKEVIECCPADGFMAKPLSLISLYKKVESMTA